jgi:hypothetical protein
VPHQPDDDDHTWDQFEYHMNAIGDITAQWRSGQISAFTKRQSIAEENRRYYCGDRKSPVTGERLTGQPRSESAAGVLADAAGIQVSAMNSALRARRAASVLAQQISDSGGTAAAAREAALEGVEAFRDIVGTALPPSGSWRPA